MSSQSGKTKSEEQAQWYLWFVAAAALGILVAHLALVFDASRIVVYASWVSLGLWSIAAIGGLHAERKQGRRAKG